MLSLLKIFTVLLSVQAHGDHSDETEAESIDPNVTVLTDGIEDLLTADTFAAFTKKNPLTLIEFYAPWCGHCKQLKPEYASAATTLLDKVPLAKVDCTTEKVTCDKMGVQGFPTLKIFRSGKPSEYKGARTASSIVEVMKRQLLPAFTELKADKVDAFVKAEKVVVLGYFDAAAAEHRKTFEEVAQALRDDFVFGVTSDADLVKKEAVKGKGVTMFKKYDDPKVVFDGVWSFEGVSEFITKKSDDLGPSNYDTYVKSGLPMAYFFFGSPEERTSLGPMFEKVAKLYQGKIIFVYLDASQFGAHADNIAFGIHVASKSEKYPFTGDIDEAGVTAFVQKFVKGEMAPFQKSEPIPKTNDEPVKILVGKNFNDFVMDTEKDVFVEFYAPWCGHCKKLSPIWDELASKIDTDKIVIAKMDAAANDAPGVEIQGFPTIILFKANDNKKVTFNGDRSVGGFYDFLVENAVHGGELGVLEDADADTAAHGEEL